MAASWLFTEAPYLRRISPGFRVIILTVLLAGAAAWIRPVDDEDETENDEDDDALLKFEREGETGNE
jgi:hypothetical protein